MKKTFKIRKLQGKTKPKLLNQNFIGKYFKIPL